MGVVVVAFAMWSTWLWLDVRTLRDSIGTQVGWLITLSEARDEASKGAAMPPDLGEVLDALARRFADEPQVVASVEAVRQASADGRSADAAALLTGELLPRIRRENGRISAKLGSRWDQVTALVFVSLCFALMALVMALLRQKSEDQLADAIARRRATEERLARVGVGLVGLGGDGEVLFANDVVESFVRRDGIASWWDALTRGRHLPGAVPCATCGRPARVGRITADDPTGPGVRTIELVFGGHAHDLSAEAYEVVLVRDVTERQRQEARNLLESKLSSLDDLAGGVVHQLNSPLQVVVGSLQLARRDAEGEVAELVDEALEGARRMGDVVTGLQVLRSAAPASVVSVAEVCRAVERLALPLCHGVVRLDVVVDGEPRVRADPARLASVLHELVRDAVLTNQGDGVTGAVELHAERADEVVLIEVRDRRPSRVAGSELRRLLAMDVATELGGTLVFRDTDDHAVARLQFDPA